MHRLFVALRPPFPMREALRALMGGVANARWQSDDQLHLTLRFIGEVDRHRGEDIAAALGAIHHPPIAITLDRIGQFDRNGRADTLWVGVTPPDPLHALHNKIDRALVRVGLAPETRSYLPHITLARLNRTSGSADPFATATVVPGISAELHEFCLYESSLGHDGAVYSIIARYPLG